MALSYTQKRLAIIGGVAAAILLIIVLVITLFTLRPANQFGDGIVIQNYDEKVKNLPNEMRDAMESYLYNILEENSRDNTSLKDIDDAFIRDESDTQSHEEESDIYSGNFIVDIESLKQSYLVQYSYSPDQESVEAAGDTVVITCLPENQLRFGVFECTDFVSQQSGDTDPIVQYLPFENFSFRLTADAEDEGTFILLAELRIPTSDLKGDVASRQQVVALYKSEVTGWIESKDLDPRKYTIAYNYDDNGNPIVLAP